MENAVNKIHQIFYDIYICKLTYNLHRRLSFHHRTILHELLGDKKHRDLQSVLFSTPRSFPNAIALGRNSF